MFAKIDWHPEKKKIKYFAVTLIAVFFIFAVIMLFLKKSETAIIITVVGILVGIMSYYLTRVGKYVYLLWMVVSWILSKIISPIVVAVIFYLIITPFGLIMRLIGRDTLQLKKKNLDSYFHEYQDPYDKESFHRQF